MFEKINLISKAWFIDAEIIIKFSKMNARIGEVNVIFKRREKGASKVNIKAVFEFVRDMFIYRFKYDKL